MPEVFLTSSRSFSSSTVKYILIHFSGDVSRISPGNSNSYWDVLALDGDNIITGRRKMLVLYKLNRQ